MPNCTPPSNGLCIKNESGLGYTVPLMLSLAASIAPAALAVNVREVGLGIDVAINEPAAKS